jgi:hypothetical protein
MRKEHLALSQTMYLRRKEANFKMASSSREATTRFAKSLVGGHGRLAKTDGQVYATGEAHKPKKALADGMVAAKNAKNAQNASGETRSTFRLSVMGWAVASIGPGYDLKMANLGIKLEAILGVKHEACRGAIEMPIRSLVEAGDEAAGVILILKKNLNGWTILRQRRITRSVHRRNFNDGKKR